MSGTTQLFFILGALCLLGIVVDPTTQGIGDSKRTLSYELPAPTKEE